LCAFAIDVDRIYVIDPDAPQLAFAWEVFITGCYLRHSIDPRDPAQHSLLEDSCLAILEQAPDDQGYGSQLLFAVYDAIERGYYPATLRPMFRSWSSRPRQLIKALDGLWSDADPQLVACAQYCLSPEVGRALSPALAPSTRQCLERMREGDWQLPPTPSAET
jgi:hypothetical protein